MLLNYIYAAFEMKEIVVPVFLDIEDAFDTVNIDILCNKLRRLGILSWVFRKA